MRVQKWLIGGIALFAVIGLGSYLINRPGALFKQLLIMAAVVGAVFLIYKIWSNRSQGGKDRNSFAKAAKQSKQRAKKRKGTAQVNHFRNRPLRRRSTAHLTVIEGKKNKKKDRAIF